MQEKTGNKRAPEWGPPRKKTAWILCLIVSGLVIAAITAVSCSGPDALLKPAVTPDQRDSGVQALAESVDQLAGEMKKLTQEMERLALVMESLSTPSEEQAASPRLPGKTTPAPASPGICGRSPSIQRGITRTLNIQSCRSITGDELYRLTHFHADIWTDLRAGDFSGMVNVTRLTLTGREEFKIPKGAFQGLDSLKKMTISFHPQGAIEPGAFQGLPNLQELIIQTHDMYTRPEKGLSVPKFDPMPNLRTVHIEGWTPAPETGQFDGLPKLETVKVNGRDGLGGMPTTISSTERTKTKGPRTAPSAGSTRPISPPGPGTTSHALS